ncbi:sce7726 family protein [Candidatus Palauibacter sp.]|uniref:sce7726 family protein n=1 Tax=Candidatus Palauibacter sp. TaxID=3101350 RepID=UPI003B01F390
MDGDHLPSQATRSRIREPAVRDPEVRPALRRYLQQEESADSNSLVIEELGLCQGAARIDLLTVSGVLHGYEIKSNRDRLTRLVSQAATYSRVLDRVTLVVCPRHFEAGVKLVPGWWGVLLVRAGAGGIAIDPIRPAARNPDQDPRALVELLWRDEALELLAHHNAAAGVRSKPRPAVWDRVCEVLEPTEIQSAVRFRLKTRRARATPA